LSFYQTLNQQPAPEVVAGRSATYSVIMVVHNALQMTRLSTVQTLRRISGHDARLVIVDNASNDGTEQWLRLLAQRGDIDVIRNETNIGHGPALELARSKTHSPYLVALDSDAFPLCDDWLSRLRAKLNDRVRVAGIRHHRDYIHPSCLLVSRQTLDDLNLSFLNEKDQPSQFDVAERISHEVKARGYEIDGLERTGAQRRGSVTEPVYLGSEYEGVVYHQWYTTRAAMAPGMQIDDVPLDSMETSLRELFERYETEPRSVTVVMGIRARPEEPERLEHAKICLQALNIQTLPRWRYRIVVVEQDETPRLERELAPFADKYIFAYNAGPYNRGWAFNVGAGTPGARAGALCLIDADLLVSTDFLQRGLERFEQGERAVLPYDEVLYLDATSTEQAIGDWLGARPLEPGRYHGQLFSTSQGGCIWVESSVYQEIGGHDERFRGWGREDREFWDRLSRTVRVEQLRGRQLHLYHPRPAEEDSWAIANQDLYDRIARGREALWTQPIGDARLYAKESAIRRTPDHAREWENWHRWDPKRIRKIVQDEEWGTGVPLEKLQWLHAIPDAYKPGMVVRGKVTKITNFGVFVELEAELEGLLHISELADHKVENPQDVVKIGEEVDVKILRVDTADRKIGLSLKRAQWGAGIYSPWEVVDFAALAIADAAPLLLVPRRCENGRAVPVERDDWNKFTLELIEAGKAAYKASQSRNQEVVSDVSNQLADACLHCHEVYRDHPGGTPVDPSNKAARCLP